MVSLMVNSSQERKSPARISQAGQRFPGERMTGFEPATSTLARLRSSQLSYIRRRLFTIARSTADASARWRAEEAGAELGDAGDGS